MPWLKLLHITAVVVWCAALLYLPALLAAAARSPLSDSGPRRDDRRRLRAFYTSVATPAALVAIASGSLIFALRGPLAPWLMAKLALVALLVLGHGTCGMLVLRSERGADAGTGMAGRLVMVTTLLWLVGIAALVLRKPAWP